MKAYVWEEKGGYGAAALVVLAIDENHARAIVRKERARRERNADAKTTAWQQRKIRDIKHEDWLYSEEGKAWAAMPSGDLMALTDDPPKVYSLDIPGVISSCWYYE